VNYSFKCIFKISSSSPFNYSWCTN